MKIFSFSKDAPFKVLQLFGYLLTVVGLLVFAVYVVAAVVSLFPRDGMAFNAGLASSLFMLAWSGALIVSGQFLHWLVSMRASQDQIIELLKEIRDKPQHN